MQKIIAAHKDEIGYGVQGEMTRIEWQELCRQKVLEGRVSFSDWQVRLPLFNDQGLEPMPSYDYVVYDEQGREQRYGLSGRPARFVLDLVGMDFDRDVDLSNIEFNMPVLGAGAIFNQIFICKTSIFRRLIDFRGAVFKSAVIFRDSEISDGALLNRVSFQDVALFDDAKFRTGIADFSSSIFAKDAYFDGVEAEALFFDGATMAAGFRLTGRGKEVGRQGLGRAMFRGVRFAGGADFSNRLFLESTDFGPRQSDVDSGGEKTYFQFAPRFYNSILHQDTSFADVVFAETAIKERGSALAFNVLRRSMQDQQNAREEQKFLRLQFDAEREESKRGASRLLYLIYKIVADYGLSVTRPAALLLIITVLGFWAMLIVAVCQMPLSVMKKISPEALLGKAVIVSVLASLPPIGLNGQIADAQTALAHGAGGHIIILLVIIFQRLLALGMWFFIALGLRNLFRLR